MKPERPIKPQEPESKLIRPEEKLELSRSELTKEDVRRILGDIRA